MTNQTKTSSDMDDSTDDENVQGCHDSDETFSEIPDGGSADEVIITHVKLFDHWDLQNNINSEQLLWWTIICKGEWGYS